MAKRTKELAKPDDKQLAEAVRTSAQQIWQAGLGAFAKAQEEGGKVFAKLVKEGTDLQKRTQKLTNGKMPDVAGTFTRVTDNMSKHAAGSWDKLEQVFEDRVARSLQSLGIPTQDDIRVLTRRVEELSKAVATLSGEKPVAAKPTARKAAPKSTVTKKTAAKTPARKASGKSESAK